MVTFTLIGLILGVFIIVADDRNIVVDDIVTETGTPAWEYAFITYLLFMTFGVIIEMLTHGSGRYSFQRMAITGLSVGITTLILNEFVTSTTGTLSTGLGNIQTEFWNWTNYLVIVMVVYIVHMFYYREE
jgi:hypothetical protein